MTVHASSVAAPVAVPYKAVDGTDKGSQQLALKVADADTAKAVVHRYMVLVQQNARRVRLRGCYGPLM
jgi:large subunit ribosomal protein L4